jgi:hypothetical protein
MYAAPVFRQAGTELGDLAEAIGGSMAGLGNFWGNDAAGQAFASSYLPAQDAILSRLGSAAGAMIGVGDGLGQMAANYDMTEYTNAFMAEQLAQAESGDVSSILSQKVRRPRLRGDAAPGPPPGALAYPAFCLAAASGDHPERKSQPDPRSGARRSAQHAGPGWPRQVAAGHSLAGG